jgi:hypothetical protein
MICISVMAFLLDATKEIPEWQCGTGAVCGEVAEGVVVALVGEMVHNRILTSP